MKHDQFHNDTSQAERRRILQLEQASTYLERARVAEQLDSERYKSEVTGTKPNVDVPAIPSGPWSAGYWQDGPEPPLGYSVNDLEPTGEVAEVERSLQELAGAQAPTSPIPGDVVEDGSSHPSPTPATPDDRPVKLKLKRLPK
jgi:hypothetical protein